MTEWYFKLYSYDLEIDLDVVSYEPNLPRDYDFRHDNYFVTEEMRVRVNEGSAALNFAYIENIGRLLDRARYAQVNGVLGRVYLMWNIGTANAVRTEIVDGNIVYEPENLRAGRYNAAQFVIEIVFKRRYYWESAVDRAVLMTYPKNKPASDYIVLYNTQLNYSANTISFTNDGGIYKIVDSANGLLKFDGVAEVTVTNSANNDGVYEVVAVTSSYIQVQQFVNAATEGDFVTISDEEDAFPRIDVDAIEGDIPVPIELQINFDTETTIDRMYLSNVWGLNDITYDFSKLFEDIGDGTVMEDGSCYSGTKAYFSWSSSNETFLFDLSADPFIYGGDHYLAIMRLATPPTPGTYIRIALNQGLNILWESALIELDTSRNLQVLCSIQLPPTGVSEKLFAYTISVYGKKSGGGNLYIDYFGLLPTLGLVRIDGFGVSTVFPYKLIVDCRHPSGIEVSRLLNPGSGRFSTYATSEFAAWGRLLLHPGLKQRLQIIYVEMDGTGLGEKYTLMAYYRPRYLTLRDQ